MHLLLSIVTGGLWIVVWIGCAIKFGGWQCPTCGSSRDLQFSFFGSLPK